MKKSAIVLFFAAFLSVSALAQSVQEGVNHVYAQRYQSAKSVFEKLLAVNPNNIDATYWLGQTLIAQKNITAAKSVYEKALMSNGNAPLLMVGMGNIDLLEGRATEAKARFETSINASKGKKGNDPNVLNAIGRVISAAHSEKNPQDIDYAIAKLTEASQLAPNNSDVFLNLGNAYRKKGNKGGEAITAYIRASQINPAMAVAPYRAAMLYRTQASYRQPETWTVVLENLNNAIKADPKFAPAYEELYFYNLLAKQDFTTAENLSKQFIGNADPSPDNRYLELQALLLQKKFAEAIGVGKEIVTQTNNNPNPRIYRAMTVASIGLKDTVTACDYINQFFAKATDDDILSSDYILRAQTCYPKNPAGMRADIVIAVLRDSVLSRQIRLINETIEEVKAGNTITGVESNNTQVFIAELRMLSYQLRGAKNSPTSPTELISYMAIPFYLGGAYQRSDSISNEYIRLAPDSIYGYYWSARAKAAIDTGAMQQGSFVANFQKAIEIGLTDTVRYKTLGITAARTLAIYFANEKKDYPTAMEYVQKGKKFDANDANLLNIEKLLNNYLKKPLPPKTPQKTNTSTNQTKDDAKTKVKKPVPKKKG